MSDCTISCLITAPDFTFAGCGVTDSIRSGYISHLLFLRCDQTIPDATDSVAIAAQIAAGTLFLTPQLTGEIPFPTAGDEVIENCQAPQPTSLTYTLNFDSVRVDNTSLTDFAKWSSIYKSLTTWTVFPITCDAVMLTPQEFSVDGVGFEARGTIAATFPNQNFQVYRGELQFKYNDVISGVALTAAVQAAIGLTGSTT